MATERVLGESGKSEGDLRGATQSVPPPLEPNGSMTNESSFRFGSTSGKDDERSDAILPAPAPTSTADPSAPKNLISSSISSPTSSHVIPVSNLEQQASDVPLPNEMNLIEENSAVVKQCTVCGTNTTPLWRRGADGSPNCNSCGK